MSAGFMGIGFFELLICVGAPLLLVIAVAVVVVLTTTRRK